MFVNTLALATVDTRTQTSFTPTSVTFGINTTVTGLLGSTIATLSTQVGALAAAQSWSATVNATTAGAPNGLVFVPGQYVLSFNIAANTGLLDGGTDLVDLNVLNSLTLIARDGNGTIDSSAITPGLLGLVDLSDPNDGLIKVNFTFTIDAPVNGSVFIDFQANNILATDTDLLSGLLGSTNTNAAIYTLSGFDVSPVPEPSHGMLAMVSLLAILRWRRR